MDLTPPTRRREGLAVQGFEHVALGDVEALLGDLTWILVQGVDPYVGLGGPISMVRVRSFHQGMLVDGILAVRSTGE
jgi:hypothetical protein